MRDPRTIILRPLLSEKSVALAAQRKYAFRVATDANKIEVRQAVEALFSGTRVSQVNTMRVSGKRRRLGGHGRRRSGRGEGRTSVWKKAIVTLSEGAIPAFEGL